MTAAHRAANAPASAVAALILAAAAATTGASTHSAGPVMASTAALGISRAAAIELERHWDRLHAGTRQGLLCTGTRGQRRSRIEGLQVYAARDIPCRYGAASVAPYLHGHVKPSDIRFTAAGSAKLLAFSLAQRWTTPRRTRARRPKISVAASVRVRFAESPLHAAAA